MAIGKRWAGAAYGTNTGNLYLTLEGEDAALSGILRFLDTAYGLSVYSITGKFDGTRIEIEGDPQNSTAERPLTRLGAVAKLTATGTLSGDWKTDGGTAGTFVLNPHIGTSIEDGFGVIATANQLYTARAHFGAIEVTRSDIIAIADEIQTDFPSSPVIVTYAAGTENSMTLEQFREAKLKVDRADVIKLYAQRPEPQGVNRVVSVEFGQSFNVAMIQSSDEAWAFGKLDVLKRSLTRFEKSYATSYKKYGNSGLNFLLLGWLITFLPSLPDWWKRASLTALVLFLIFLMNRLQVKYLPLSAIYLSSKPSGFVARYGSAIASWFFALLSALITFVASEYLRRYL